MNMHSPALSEIGRAAVGYARAQGWHVFPAPPGKKQSYESAADNDGRRWGATDDPEIATSHFVKWPRACVGIACQESGIFVLDLDVKNGADGVSWLAEKIAERGDWPDTVEALSPSGSWHVYFRYPDDFDPLTCESQIAPGVDLRGHGGMVIAPPSTKPGADNLYRWKNPPGLFDVAAAPQWVLDLLPRREKLSERAKAKPKDGSGPRFDFGESAGARKTVEDYRRLVMAASTDGEKHKATLKLAGSLAAQGVKQDFAAGLIQAICPVWDDNLRKSIESGYAKYRRADFRHTDLDLVRDDKDRPIWNVANAEALLVQHDDWQGVLAYNAFTNSRVLLRPVPGQSGGTFPRDLEDDDYTAAQAWFHRNGFPKADAGNVVAAVRKVARHHTFDPLTDYLDGLKWDGTPRLSGWLTAYCGAEANDYTAEAGKRWLISAVARAYRPGCKADHMLVLEGDQGKRKSTAAATLAGEAWFSDALPQMHTKDASSYLRGKWIIEVAELESMRKEIDAVKAFISRQVEHYRPAYGREEVSEPRRCVFIGTTNKDDWQRDETGGRRFWPVKVGEIDVAALARDRDQLWAEAVVAYQAGERWWLEGEVEKTARDEVAARQADDPWAADVARAVAGWDEVATKQVLAALDFKTKDMTQQDGKRVAKELVKLGWHKAGQFTSGPYKGSARYVAPEGGSDG